MDDHWRSESAQDFPASGPDAGSVDGAAHPDMDGFNCYLREEEPLFNLDGIDHSGLYNSASNTAPYNFQQGAWPSSWTTFDQLSDPIFAQLPDSNLPIPLPHNIPDNPPVAQRPLTDVSQWLDGAYSPPVPCTYCRRHRLQCLIIRTTSANPNPVTACSSCVALFRECSLALGEKRQPSRFETLSPVLGNLHGLREICEDAPTGTTSEANCSALPALEEGSSSHNPESKQFVRKGARVLRSWFLQHQSHPYPTEEQKSELVLETGFSKQRISTWFANARRRQKQKQQQRENPNPPASSARIFRAGSPMPSSSWASMTPLERWQASPPEDDPVPESTIRDAIASTTPAPAQGSEPQSQNQPPSASSQDDFSFFFSSPQFDMDLDLDLGGTALDTFLNLDDHETSSHLDSSVSGFGSRRSDVSSDSISSAWSLQSDGGVPLPVPASSHLRHNRNRSSSSRPLHRRSSSRRSLNSPTESTKTYTYQCTFCPQSFKKKNDWSRHESSVHLTLESWVCTPNLSDLFPPSPQQVHEQDQAQLQPQSSPAHHPHPQTTANPPYETTPTQQPKECRFCNHPINPSPNPTHDQDHDFPTCAAKPPSERSFPRKDHLVQHLRKYHACTKPPVPDLSAWRVSRRGASGSRSGRGGGVNVGDVGGEDQVNQTRGQDQSQGHVRSRCGFCGLVLKSWNARVDHLAGHFREGCRMAEWIGDWGFEEDVMRGLRRAVVPGLRG